MSDKKTKFEDLFNNNKPQTESIDSFANEMQGVTPFKQDKIHFGKALSKQNRALASNFKEDIRPNLDKDEKFSQNRFHFSDEYEPLIDVTQALSYVKPGHPSYMAKLLRRGELPPEIVLDLHGYNKDSAKRDLADLITTCQSEQILCACVVHGVGGGILKRKVPHYLLQHPDVIALHQAPLEWGGQGAILFIVDLGEDLEFLLKQ